jgi:PLP dependent protein
MVDIAQWQAIKDELAEKNVTLVAVSKKKPATDVQALYNCGQRDFGENYVQELIEKQQSLPSDIRWHFIGHLQSNKVKYIAPFVHLIHGVDNERLLAEINKCGAKNQRTIDVLLQVFIATEETKFGLDELELHNLVSEVVPNPERWAHINLRGLMGMASNTQDAQQVRAEFRSLHQMFVAMGQLLPTSHQFDTCSMGMSMDYRMAIEEGSTLVRIGSLLFGAR